MGYHNDKDLPDGLVRMVNQFGNVYEGVVTPDGKLNGFGIVYNG